MIPRLRPQIGWKELFASLAFWKGKDHVAVYEQEFASKFGNNHGIMFAHGRTALYYLLKAWNLKDHEVICPSYTCVVVQHAISLSENIPVFVDSPKNDFNMDLDAFRLSFTQKTRVVIATHLFGYPVDVEKIKNIVEEQEEKFGHKIYVVQDVAHSYGADHKGAFVTQFGDASIFGCNISKIMTSIFGGMVLTNDSELAAKLQSIRTEQSEKGVISKSISRFIYLWAVSVAFLSPVYSFVNWLERKGMLNSFVKYYDDDKIYFPKDWNSPVTGIEARVGSVQLKKYDWIISQRRANARAWINHFSGNQGITFLDRPDGATYSHCVALVEDRDAWVKKYLEHGIQLGILIEYSVPHMAAYSKSVQDDHSNSLYYSQHAINFPIWAGLDIKKAIKKAPIVA